MGGAVGEGAVEQRVAGRDRHRGNAKEQVLHGLPPDQPRGARVLRRGQLRPGVALGSTGYVLHRRQDRGKCGCCC